MPIGRAPLRDDMGIGVAVLSGILIGWGTQAALDVWAISIYTGVVGVAATLAPLCLYNERLPMQGMTERVQSDWDVLIDAAQDPERAEEQTQTAEAIVPAAPRSEAAPVILSASVLRRELASPFLAEPIPPRAIESVDGLKAVMADAVAPDRARARHLVSLLRDPETFADDAVLEDIKAYLAALDARAPEDAEHTVQLMQQLRVSAAGIGWQRWNDDSANCAYFDDDGLAMLFAACDVDDETFISEVHAELCAIACDLEDVHGAGAHRLRTQEYSGWPLPKLLVHSEPNEMSYLETGTTVGAFGVVGGLLGLGFGALTGADLLSCTLYSGGATVLGMSALAAKLNANDRRRYVKDSHVRTLQWIDHIRCAQDYVVRMPQTQTNVAPDIAA